MTKPLKIASAATLAGALASAPVRTARRNPSAPMPKCRSQSRAISLGARSSSPSGSATSTKSFPVPCPFVNLSSAMAGSLASVRGAGLRAPALGLGRVHIELPTADELAAVARRMREHGVGVRDDGRSVALDDPWGNAIELSVRS